MKRMLFVMSLLSVCVASLADNNSDISAQNALFLLLEQAGNQALSSGYYAIRIVQEGDCYYFQESRDDITSLCHILKEEADKDELLDTVTTLKVELVREAPYTIRLLFTGIKPLSDEQIKTMAALYVLHDVLRLLKGEELSAQRSSRHSLLKRSDDPWFADRRYNQRQFSSKTPKPAGDTNVPKRAHKNVYEYIISVDGPLNPFEW